MLDFESHDLYHVFYNGMAIVKDGSDSWRDSIGRNVLMWIAYNQDERLECGLESCLQWEGDKYVLYRHPNVIGVEGYKNDISRDHWSYFLIYRKLRFSEEDFNAFVKEVPVKPGLRSWVRAMQGSKFWSIWYYSFQIVGNWLGNGWNKFWRKVGNIGDEYSNYDWNTLGNYIQLNLSLRQRFFRKFLIPTYPQHNKGWQLYALPKHPLKKRLKKILLKRIINRNGYSNYLLRILFGDTTVREQDVLGYMHMTGYRWGTNLDESCRRDVKILSQHLVRANGYEKDLLHFAYNNMQNFQD